MEPPKDTIDITNVVESLRKSFVEWGVAYVFGLQVALPGMGWLALPIISDLDRAIIRAILNALSLSAVMEAFFLSTAIRKASQAQDYISAVDSKNALPPTATNKEIKDAEEKEMVAFRHLVILSE